MTGWEGDQDAGNALVPDLQYGDPYTERMLLGSCLAMPDQAVRLLADIRPDDFGDPVHREVCASILADGADPFTTAEHLRRSGLDVTVVADILVCAVTPGMALGARQAVMRQSFRRAVLASGERLAQAALEASSDEVLLSVVRTSVESLRQHAVRTGVR